MCAHVHAGPCRLGTDNFGSFDLNLLRHERFREALIVAGQDRLPPCDLAMFVLSPQQLGGVPRRSIAALAAKELAALAFTTAVVLPSQASLAVSGGADRDLLGYYSKADLDKLVSAGARKRGAPAPPPPCPPH